MKNCFLFPGQGAQYPGMGQDLWEVSGGVKELFELASDITSIDLKKLLFQGGEEELKATDRTQVAVTLVNLSAALVLKERDIEAAGCAGFSLGEYAALKEAGVIETEDVFRLVKIRGDLMEKASRSCDSAAGKSGMAAVIGLSYDEAAEVIQKLAGDEVYIGLHNSPTQVVISGKAEGLTKAESHFDEAGAMRFVLLRTSGPFHSPLLSEAAEGFEQALSGVKFNDPVKSVYSNVTGAIVKTGAQARDLCVRQIISTLRWLDEERTILADGYDRFLEVGPGKVLTGLWKSFHKENRCIPAGKLEEIEKIDQKSGTS